MTAKRRDTEHAHLAPTDAPTHDETTIASAFAPPPRRTGLLRNVHVVGVVLVIVVAVIVFLLAMSG